MQFAIWHDKGDTAPKTMYRIARALDLTPQYRLTELLQELVNEGKLSVETRDQSGRFTTKFYSLLALSTLITEKYGKRRIVVKQRGLVTDTLEVPLGQMELWS